jgi:addiction module RelE/StbE family toxin
MQMVWLKTALRNLDEITSFIAQENSAAASQVVEAIYTQVSLLSKQAALGRSGRVLGTRELVISNTHYLVPYRIRNNTVEILRVFHTSRNPTINW